MFPAVINSLFVLFEKKKDLSHNKIGDAGASRLAAWLETPNVLKHLNLAYNFIGKEGFFIFYILRFPHLPIQFWGS